MRPHGRNVFYFVSMALLMAMLLPLRAGAASNDAAYRDLSPLVEFVAPIYTAMYFAGVCALVDRGYIRPVGDQGTILHYAEHIKGEIAALLPENEAILVFKKADDLAKTVANEHLKKFGAGRKIVDGEEIASWCASFVTNFVRELVERHDSDHASNHVSLFRQYRELPEAPR